ncbi:glycosyltransferase [Candidatus Methanoperedens sp. BLZ2]|nr:glycosyltransferase [Candidatus Methanoperedens sp. BLZ2]
MEKPCVSIIVPVLNGANHINNLMNSLMNINYPKNKYEILIVDNESMDKTVELIKKFQRNIPQLKLFFEKRRSSYAARNMGVMNAKGEIIVFTDADCVVDKNWLINIVKSFSENSVGCVAGEILSAKWNNIVEEYYAKKDIMSQKNTLNSEFLPYPMTANVAYRKEIFNKIGYFDEELISGGDADFAWRMQLETEYKIVYDQNAIVIHKHRSNMKSLFKQQFSYGYGSVLLYRKHNYFMDFNLKNILMDYLKLMLAFALFYFRLFARLFWDCDRYCLYEPLLAFLCISGYRLGRLYGSIKLKKLFI